MFTQLDQNHVILELDPAWQTSTADAGAPVRRARASGRPGAVEHAGQRQDTSKVPIIVDRQGVFPASYPVVLISAPAVMPGSQRSLAMQSGCPAVAIPIRAGSFQGTAQAFQDSFKSQPWLILAAILTVYIVLGVLYENAIHPLTIISTLPSAGLAHCWH